MATQVSTLSILLMDVAVGLGCGVAAYLLSAYTTTTIVGGATTKIVTIIPKKIEESITKAANTATNQLAQTANDQIVLLQVLCVVLNAQLTNKKSVRSDHLHHR